MSAVLLDHVSKRYWLRSSPYGLLRDDLAQLASRLNPFRWPGSRRSSSTEDAPPGASEFWALKEICLAVPPGEALGIIGPNGAGKSTILKLIAGIVHPTSGTIALAGRVGALIEVGAGIHPELSGRENIFLYGSLLGIPRREIARKFDAIVAFAELERFIDQPIKRYSSGMQMRLGFAVAAHLDPEILLVDEVLAVGDAAFQQKCLERMRAVRAAGTTVLFVSHALETVAATCDRALFLSEGRIAFLGPVAEAVQAYLRHPRQVRVRLPETYAGVETLRTDQVTHAATMGEITLRNAQGETTHTVKSGGAATVRVEISFHEELEAPVLGFILRNSAGLEVANTNTLWMRRSPQSGADLGRFHPGQQIVVEYRLRLPLTQGQYYLSTGIATGDLRAFCDWRDDALSFFIEDESGARGIVNLCPQLFIDGIELREGVTKGDEEMTGERETGA
jgi:lipopolysaccharide transport system ATP-binding protein